MKDILIASSIFIISIGIAIIIKIFFDYQEKKELENNKKKEQSQSKEKTVVPDITILNDSQEIGMKKLLEDFSRNEEKIIPLGWNEKENIKTFNFDENSHLLIIGTTGGGKSICLNEIISSIILNYNSEEIKIVTIDTSMVELSSFNGIPHYIKDTIISPNSIIEEIEELQKEIKRRKKGEDNPEIMVLIDDFYDICSYDSKILPTIESMLEDSKKKNIHFIIATDTPCKEILTENIKKNIDGTIYLTLAPGEKEDFKLDLTEKDNDFLTEIGNAIYIINNEKENIKIPEIKENEINEIKKCFSKNI